MGGSLSPWLINDSQVGNNTLPLRSEDMECKKCNEDMELKEVCEKTKFGEKYISCKLWWCPSCHNLVEVNYNRHGRAKK